MASIFKLQLLIRQEEVGWSEGYYVEVADFTVAKNVALGLVRLRQDCFGFDNGNTPRITWFRVTQLTGGSKTQLFSNQITFKPTTLFDKPDMPWTGVQTTLIASGGSKRQFTIKGVPDDQTNVSFLKPVAGALKTAIDALLDRMKNSEYRIQVQLHTGDGALRDITSVVANSGGYVTVTVPVAHGLAAGGDYITWYHIKASGAVLTGRHFALAVDATTFRVFRYNLATVGFESGFYRVYRRQFEGIVDTEVGRKTKHNVGRPFCPLRGRRRIARR